MRACALALHGCLLLLAVLSSLTAGCTQILTTALYVQSRFAQEDDVRKPKVENWTTFAPCCFCCGRAVGLRTVLELRKMHRVQQSQSYRGRLETCSTFQASACRCRSTSSARQTPTRWLECKSGTHSGGIPPRQRRGLQTSVKEAKVLMAEMNSNGPWQCSRRSTSTRTVPKLLQDRSGCMQSRQRFLHQLEGVSCSTRAQHHKGMCKGWKNEANSSESEQTTHRQTGLGSRRTGRHRESQQGDGCNTELV